MRRARRVVQNKVYSNRGLNEVPVTKLTWAIRSSLVFLYLTNRRKKIKKKKKLPLAATVPACVRVAAAAPCCRRRFYAAAAAAVVGPRSHCHPQPPVVPFPFFSFPVSLLLLSTQPCLLPVDLLFWLAAAATDDFLLAAAAWSEEKGAGE